MSEPGRWMRVHDWDEDAGELLSEIEFHSNRYRDLLDVNMFIGCEKAAIVTQLMQWFYFPYHIPVVFPWAATDHRPSSMRRSNTPSALAPHMTGPT